LQDTHQLPPSLKDACTGNLPLRILRAKQAINHQLLSAHALVSQMSNPHFGLQLCICNLFACTIRSEVIVPVSIYLFHWWLVENCLFSKHSQKMWAQSRKKLPLKITSKKLLNHSSIIWMCPFRHENSIVHKTSVQSALYQVSVWHQSVQPNKIHKDKETSPKGNFKRNASLIDSCTS
jgi:hypothetical protein